ncbi:unnamed protein product [Gongylonema pulchrum]|uniref:Uncharacterized protein n=1 Tax=Gongylonema pulchrum TaxID=637853 RepID=A0A183CWG8_9BILA|nr:unnamed protein product [Gongylonema pulchrum]
MLCGNGVVTAAAILQDHLPLQDHTVPLLVPDTKHSSNLGFFEPQNLPLFQDHPVTDVASDSDIHSRLHISGKCFFVLE